MGKLKFVKNSLSVAAKRIYMDIKKQPQVECPKCRTTFGLTKAQAEPNPVSSLAKIIMCPVCNTSLIINDGEEEFNQNEKKQLIPTIKLKSSLVEDIDDIGIDVDDEEGKDHENVAIPATDANDNNKEVVEDNKEEQVKNEELDSYQAPIINDNEETKEEIQQDE